MLAARRFFSSVTPSLERAFQFASESRASMSYAAFSDGDSSTAVGSSFVRFADEDEGETQKETAS